MPLQSEDSLHNGIKAKFKEIGWIKWKQVLKNILLLKIFTLRNTLKRDNSLI